MIPPDRVHGTYHQTAVAIETVMPRPRSVERLAYHYAQTDDDAKPSSISLRWSQGATMLGLHQEAVEFSGLVTARNDDISGRDAIHPDAVKPRPLRVGTRFHALGRMDEAERALRDAVTAGAADRIHTNWPFTYFWLCEALFWLGQWRRRSPPRRKV
ncbi:MAG: hypothetical protein R2854_19560 [Caldilineaceae bacterium]